MAATIQTSYKKRMSPLYQLNSHSLMMKQNPPFLRTLARGQQSLLGAVKEIPAWVWKQDRKAISKYCFGFETMLQNRWEKKALAFTYLEKDYCHVYSRKYWHLDNPKIWGLSTCGVSYTNIGVTVLCTNVKLPAEWDFIKRLNWKPETKLDHHIF